METNKEMSEIIKNIRNVGNTEKEKASSFIEKDNKENRIKSSLLTSIIKNKYCVK